MTNSFEESTLETKIPNSALSPYTYTYWISPLISHSRTFHEWGWVIMQIRWCQLNTLVKNDQFLVEFNLLNLVIIQTRGSMIQWLQLENMSPAVSITVTWVALNSEIMMINFNLLIQMMSLLYQSNLEARERNYHEVNLVTHICILTSLEDLGIILIGLLHLSLPCESTDWPRIWSSGIASNVNIYSPQKCKYDDIYTCNFLL